LNNTSEGERKKPGVVDPLLHFLPLLQACSQGD
jgi:hypothetical protein